MRACRQGILAGTVLSFARALGEYGATSMLIGYTPGRTATVATTVYQLWRTNDEAGAMFWVLIDLAYAYEIDKVLLFGRSGDDYFPYKFRIEVSEDGKTYQKVFDGECPEKREGQQPFECKLENVKARYVRIVGYSLRDQPGFNDGHLFSLCEVEIYRA
jgi:hypothetical protein